MSNENSPLTALRAKAEALLAARTNDDAGQIRRSVDELLHEVEVYQVELELQNEELRLAQHTLQLLHRRYHNLFDYAPVGYIEMMPDGQVIEVNRGVLSQLNLSRRSIHGKPFSVFVDPAGHDAFYNHLMAAMRTNEACVVQLSLRHRDGNDFFGELRSIAFQDGESQEWRILTSILDVTDRRKAEAARAEWERSVLAAKEDAEALARLKSSLLANMSHEIRSPLTAIIGFAQVLEDMVGEDGREFTDLILSSGERLLETMNSVLDLARVEGRAPGTAEEPIDIRQPIDEAIRLFGHQAQEKDLALVFERPDEAMMLAVDASALHRIVVNLVGNAIKFTEKGRVEVSMSRDQQGIRIRVRDTGRGISSEFKGRIFDAFEQESMGMNRSHEGSGLGLAITKKLVEQLGATITVESEQGEGSQFEVFFPAFAPAVAPAKKGGVALPSVPSSRHPRPANRRPCVLAVDDEPVARKLVEIALAKHYDLHSFADPAACLEAADGLFPDVIVLDVALGRGMTGIELLEALRKLDGYADVPVIALTSYVAPSDREQLLASGFDGYLSKPFVPRTLQRAVELGQHVVKLVDATPSSQSYDWTALLARNRRSSLVEYIRQEGATATLISGPIYFRLSADEAALTLKMVHESLITDDRR